MMDNEVYEFKPIGRMKSWYKAKNATPRQASICPESKGVIELNKNFFDKPHLSLEDLDQYTHVWILFLFHQNTNKKVHAKVKPPRLDGIKTGLFATRSPHRPNPIGLSLTKLEKIEQNCIHVSGIDLLDNTPVLDIKPYISEYDYPEASDDPASNSNKPKWIGCKGVEPKTKSDWAKIKSKVEVIDLNAKLGIGPDNGMEGADSSDSKGSDRAVDEPKTSTLKVTFTARSEEQLNRFHAKDSDEHSAQHLITDPSQLKNFYLNFGKTKRAVAQTGQPEAAAQTGQLEDVAQTDQLEAAVPLGEPLEGAPDSEKADQERAGKELNDDLVDRSVKCRYCLAILSDPEKVKRAITNILEADPRSVYRRSVGVDKLYYFTVDTCHITAWFDEEERLVEVLKIKPNYV